MVCNFKDSEFITPSTILLICNGLPFLSSSGRNSSGQFWKETGRTNRFTASGPTEVKRESVVDGNGPPCCMAYTTSTPVGIPLNSSLPHLSLRILISIGLLRTSSSVAAMVMVNCPFHCWAIFMISSSVSHATTIPNGPKTSSLKTGLFRNVLAFVFITEALP